MHRCCFTAVGGRVGLFDGLSQRCSDDGDTHQEAEADNSTEPLLQTLPLLIPAKHLAVISAVRSSPPPDLGLPMAADDDGSPTNPNGPPVLEPELNDDDDTGDAAAASAEATVSECTAAPLTAAASDNGVTIID